MLIFILIIILIISTSTALIIIIIINIVIILIISIIPLTILCRGCLVGTSHWLKPGWPSRSELLAGSISA
eukprot:754038-Karenia_brevis.AAC.1